MYCLILLDHVQRDFFPYNRFEKNESISWNTAVVLMVIIVQQCAVSAVYLNMMRKRLLSEATRVNTLLLFLLFITSFVIIGVDYLSPLGLYLTDPMALIPWAFRGAQLIFGLVFILYIVEIL